MQNLNKSFLLLIGFWLNQLVHAQSTITFDGSKVFSSFKFVTSEGEATKYSYGTGSAYNLGYLHTTKSRFVFGGGIGLRKAGATKVVEENEFVWDLQYAEGKLQVGYLLDKWRVSPIVLVSPYFASLLTANQSMGGKVRETKNMYSNTDFGITGSLGLTMKISDYVYLYTFYNQIIGIQNIEKSTSQQSFNRGFSITLGLGFTINKLSTTSIK